MIDHILQLAWNEREPWVEVTRGSLDYCRKIRAAERRYTGVTRIIKVTTTTEVVE